MTTRTIELIPTVTDDELETVRKAIEALYRNAIGEWSGEVDTLRAVGEVREPAQVVAWALTPNDNSDGFGRVDSGRVAKGSELYRQGFTHWLSISGAMIQYDNTGEGWEFRTRAVYGRDQGRGHIEWDLPDDRQLVTVERFAPGYLS